MPEHMHDCDRCRYLGTVQMIGRTLDIYNCTSIISPEGSIILRYGSDGPEYSSLDVSTARQVAENDGGWLTSYAYRYALTLL